MQQGWGGGYGAQAGFGGGGYDGSYAGQDAGFGGGGYGGAPWGGDQGQDSGNSKGKGGGGGKGAGGKGICKFFQEGRCTRGDSCSFSHGDGAAGAGGGGGKSGGGGGGGKGICKFFLEGKCTRGSSCAFSHEAEDDEDPEMAEINAAIDKAQGGKDDELDHIEKMMAGASDQPTTKDDDASSQGDPLPPPASEAEIAEAQEIVRKAQEELVERNKMKAKVNSGCNNTDLQAMINARLAKK